MTSTGEIFLNIRKNKGLTAKEVAHGIISPQFLRKFENNMSDISLNNFLELLARVDTTMIEFVSETDNTIDVWLKSVEYDLDVAFNSGNSFLLKKFIEENEKSFAETREKRFFLVSLVGKFYYNHSFHAVYEMDAAPILEHLRKIEQWGKFELFLGTYMYLFFEDEEAFIYGNQLLKKRHPSFEINQWRNDLALHFALKLIQNNNLGHAEKILSFYFSRIASQHDTSYIHNDLFAKFVQGIFTMKTGNKQGSKQVEEILSIFHDVLGYTDYANKLNTLYIFFQNK
ncbi:Rgg family transcriptional regulator [Vagococcus elongatus]|uniref:HTH cro/C1-type domain-containing protein n=1 Tax=Vagococcus elongatus TaxID=180344 RepID=A0A430AX84_9ENTE|nr:Rgg/GadR/MutR family transcriptional regulator [Vagococcus elongatus]RSU12655.1 hypothetical protein CBF29_05875 [Vagococcus elongatus]